MKKVLLTIIIAATLSGCGRDQPIPASRLVQPAGNFSFVTPDGWFRNKLPGVEFIIVSTDPDHGMNPNIFVDFVSTSLELIDAAEKLSRSYVSTYRGHRVVERGRFETASGLRGIKLAAVRKNKNGEKCRKRFVEVVFSACSPAEMILCAAESDPAGNPIGDDVLRPEMAVASRIQVVIDTPEDQRLVRYDDKTSLFEKTGRGNEITYESSRLRPQREADG
jgi:hypothetical protein